MNKMMSHFKTILTHKCYVFLNCQKAGLFWQGIKHDMSKFSPTEFFESVKYYTGTNSPINKCKKENGYSKAWLHHKGRNQHHYEYWIDNADCGGKPIKMPYKYALELVCDYIGAGKAYMKENFSYNNEYLWWMKRRENIAMHPDTLSFVDLMLATMAFENSNDCLRKERSLQLYEKCNKQKE